MRKLIYSAIVALAGCLVAGAQDYNAAMASFNKANDALAAGRYEEAVKEFTAAAEEASKCNDEKAAGLLEASNKGVTQAMYAEANQLVKDGKLDQAIESLAKVVEVAKANNCGEIADNAGNLKKQVIKLYANNEIKAAAISKSEEEKIGHYNKAIEKLDQLVAEGLEDSKIYIQKGQVLKSLGKQQEAIECFTKAKEMGDEGAANKQLSKLFLQEAQAKMNKKDYAGAIESAIKSTEYEKTATAYKIAGTAANNAKKIDDAITYLSKYLELAPDAKDAAQIKAAIETLKSQASK